MLKSFLRAGPCPLPWPASPWCGSLAFRLMPCATGTPRAELSTLGFRFAARRARLLDPNRETFKCAILQGNRIAASVCCLVSSAMLSCLPCLAFSRKTHFWGDSILFGRRRIGESKGSPGWL
jgi:hypothetical protein